MPAQSAKIIDLQAYRAERGAMQAQAGFGRQGAAETGPAVLPLPMMMPMAWVPVWFVPVSFSEARPTLG